jgi:hypothetical protein
MGEINFKLDTHCRLCDKPFHWGKPCEVTEAERLRVELAASLREIEELRAELKKCKEGTRETYYQDTPEQCWNECCPAFESSLGALQDSGVADKVLALEDFDATAWSAEELAFEMCLRFLALDTETNAALNVGNSKAT